jgi:hypothetical protein
MGAVRGVSIDADQDPSGRKSDALVSRNLEREPSVRCHPL